MYFLAPVSSLSSLITQMTPKALEDAGLDETAFIKLCTFISLLWNAWKLNISEERISDAATAFLTCAAECWDPDQFFIWKNIIYKLYTNIFKFRSFAKET